MHPEGSTPKRQRPRRGRAALGFTLVELMAAALIASILVITASTFLVGVFQNYSKNRRYVELQRDGAATLQLIGKQVREADSSQVTTSNNVLRIVGTNNVARTFHASGRHLLYDPNTAVLGDEVRIVDGRLQAFTVSNDYRAAHITLHLGEDVEESILRAQFTYRN